MCWERNRTWSRLFFRFPNSKGFPVANEFLHQRLEQLHRELAQVKEVDSETLESLQRLSADFRRLLENPKSGKTDTPSEAISIREQIEQLNSSHPLVVRFVSQVTEGLASLGI